ncbi:MAG TPA: glycosyltransferase [Chloroflexota bacterium]|nr:glycosyltransferase [Chloroflexota bacterium]
MSTFETSEPEPVSILFVHASDELYGSDRALLEIIRGLDGRIFRPVVILPDDLPYEGFLSAELARLGISVRKMDLAVVRRSTLRWRDGPRLMMRLGRSVFRLSRLIREERIGLVHTNTIVVWPGAFAALLCRVPHVWHVHEVLGGPRALRVLAGRVVVALSAAVVTNSGATTSALVGTRPPLRVELVPNGVEVPAVSPSTRDRVRRDWGVSDERTVVFGAIGRISARKGLSDLLAAFAQARAGDTGFHLVLAGSTVPGQESQLDQLESLAIQLGLGPHVTFTGFFRDPAEIVAGIDVLVMPVLRPESFGLAAAEAMAAGKPVIASNLPALDELVANDETGILVPPGDVPALAGAIRRLAADRALRESFGQAGRKRIEECFSLAAYRHRFASLYARLSAVASGRL